MLFKRGKKEPVIDMPCDKRAFKKIIEENKVVVVDFWARWCFPCIIYSRSFKKAASRLSSKALFVKVNVGECYSIAKKYNIFGVPTTIIFVDGNPVRRIVGLMSDETLVNMVKMYLK